MSTLLISLPPGALAEDQLAEVRAAAPDHRLVYTYDRAEQEALMDEVDIVAGWVSHALLGRAARLRWYQQWGAGADWLLRHPAALAQPFTLTNVSGIHAIPISEHILALMLSFARGLPDSLRAQQRREWTRQSEHDTRIFELAGKTVLLVGIGAIGQRTAQVAAALGMRVLGVRRAPSAQLPGVERLVGPDELDALLPEADFVVLILPLTDETRGLFGARQLALMKPSAYLINVGRGATVDEASLVEALRAGRIAGAGLDVFEVEPLPVDSPLWEMEEVIVTAHYSGITPHYHERALAIFLDNLRRLQAGAPLRNVVDKRRGY